jgi:hypothetical protein
MVQNIWAGIPWQDMTAEQKFEFLHQWCENLTEQTRRQGDHINDLHARLRRVEDRDKPAAS